MTAKINTLLISLLLLTQLVNGQKTNVKNGLKISANKHYLCDAKTGAPVFILATTAWNINSLTYPEIDTLIQSIAGNGFNALMFALDFYPQADEANVYGQKAFTGPERTELNPLYFAYCDYIIDKCTRNGIYPFLYTMWSGKTTGVMSTYTPQQLYILGLKLGEKYKGHKNVILIAGGESSPPYIDTARVNAMGNGLKLGSGGSNLVAVHPTSPHSTSGYYAESPWLDFYMSQAKSNLSGITYDLTKNVTIDYNYPITKPTMVGEHRYESGISEDPLVQRRSLYLSIFAGGFGYAYGHNALWQMTPHTAQPWMLKSWNPGVNDWKKALNTVAQTQLHHIKTLLNALPYFTRIPDQSLILSGQGDSVSTKVQAMRDGSAGKNDATYIMAYISSEKSITLKTDVLPAAKLNAFWFNPRTGLSEVIDQQFKNNGTFTAERKDGPDWVLLITDAVKAYRLPMAK